MNKVYVFSIILGVLFMGGNVLATVGGPTLIYDFKYNSVDESVYYILQSEGGRGCPPELVKMSLNTGKSQVVFSCDEGEKLMEGKGYEFSPVNTEISKRTENFKYLSAINLADNKISVDISFVNYSNFAADMPEIKNANFIATVYQGDKKVSEFPVTGCSMKQPFVFAGYAIPGFDKKIVLLLSAKGDCWEGGYINESLHVVGGVDGLDKTESYSYKGPSALVPNEGTLVVFEKDTVDTTNGANNPEASKDVSNKNIKIPYAIIAVVLGLGLGYFFGRKKAI